MVLSLPMFAMSRVNIILQLDGKWKNWKKMAHSDGWKQKGFKRYWKKKLIVLFHIHHSNWKGQISELGFKWCADMKLDQYHHGLKRCYQLRGHNKLRWVQVSLLWLEKKWACSLQLTISCRYTTVKALRNCVLLIFHFHLKSNVREHFKHYYGISINIYHIT